MRVIALAFLLSFVTSWCMDEDGIKQQALLWRQRELQVEVQNDTIEGFDRLFFWRVKYRGCCGIETIAPKGIEFECRVLENGDISIFYHYRLKDKLIAPWCCCCVLGNIPEDIGEGWADCISSIFCELLEVWPRYKDYNNPKNHPSESRHAFIYDAQSQQWGLEYGKSVKHISFKRSFYKDFNPGCYEVIELCRKALEKSSVILPRERWAFDANLDTFVGALFEQNKLIIITPGPWARCLKIAEALYDASIKFE